MTPDVLDHVFEPFFTTKNDGRGTGLGLSQVYGFVKQSGGHVTVSSLPNAGTTVKILLPAVTSPSSAPSHIEPTEPLLQIPGARASETILVVEDDDDVRNYTVSSLIELGYRVHEAPNAAIALEALRQQRDIALLFTDLGLPGEIDGRQLADRARSANPSLKVLITTAYAAASLVHEGRLDPGIELLKKPFSFAALAVRIRELLDIKPGTDAAAARVLVVEDDPLLQIFVAEMLAECGLIADVAGSFRDAMTRIQDETADALAGAIIDLGLPDRPGDELVTEIRSLHLDLPIVLATGYADSGVRDRFANVPRMQILTKPFNASELATMLKSIGVRISPPT